VINPCGASPCFLTLISFYLAPKNTKGRGSADPILQACYVGALVASAVLGGRSSRGLPVKLRAVALVARAIPLAGLATARCLRSRACSRCQRRRTRLHTTSAIPVVIGTTPRRDVCGSAPATSSLARMHPALSSPLIAASSGSEQAHRVHRIRRRPPLSLMMV